MTIPDILAHPYFSAAVAVLTAIIVGLVRRYSPEWWARIPERIQVVPALVVAASLSAGVEAGKALAGIGNELVPLLQDFATTTVLAWLGSMGTQQAAKRIPIVGSTPPDPPAGVTKRISLPSPKDSKAPPMGPLGGAAIVLLLAGCSASTADRQLCFARAEARAVAEAAKCPDDWESCPERPRILSQLQTDQEACP